MAGCDDASPTDPGDPKPIELTPVATVGSDMVTGVAVSPTGRVFVTFPRLFLEPGTASVAEVGSDGALRPYPDQAMNSWQAGQPVDAMFVSIQSAYADPRGHLWVLDTGNPFLMGALPGAAKLVEIDLATDQVVRTIAFDSDAVPAGGFLNDVRLDAAGQHAYITDANLGRILVVDLGDSSVRAVLEGHPSMRGEDGVIATVHGFEMRLPDGSPVVGHVDGIAVTDTFVYYHALTARTLYRVPVALLNDPATTAEKLAQAVEAVAETGVHDGMEADKAGNVYLTDVETSAIARYSTDGKLEVLVSDTRAEWPDSLAIGPDGFLYVTMSQIHLLPPFNGGADRRTTPGGVYRLELP